jgi:hypothetical protein
MTAKAFPVQTEDLCWEGLAEFGDGAGDPGVQLEVWVVTVGVGRPDLTAMSHCRPFGSWPARCSPARWPPDRNSRFHRYDLVQPTPDIANLLNEIERDPAYRRRDRQGH